MYKLSFFLVFMVLIIWNSFYQAKDLPYDENYANILGGLSLSLLSVIGLLILFFKKREIIKNNLIAVLLFLITSSPISLYYALINFDYIFGKALAH